MDAAAAMERESNVGLEKWEAADNIDLAYVLQDFEEYFEIKFQKKPLLVKRNPNFGEEDGHNGARKPPPGSKLPKINSAQGKITPQTNDRKSG